MALRSGSHSTSGCPPALGTGRQRSSTARPPTFGCGIPTMGVANVRKLFKKVVLVATGSGIGPMLGHLLDTSVPSRLVWVTKNPRRTYGDQLIDEIEGAHPDALIWEPASAASPAFCSRRMPPTSNRARRPSSASSTGPSPGSWCTGLTRRGIPAFGPIWDS
jgi:hypothetical protein